MLATMHERRCHRSCVACQALSGIGSYQSLARYWAEAQGEQRERERTKKKMEGKCKPQWETQMRTWPAAIRPRGLDRLYLIWSSLPQNQSNLPQWADRARNQTANPAQKGSWCGAEWGNIRLCRIVVGMQTITAIKVFALLKKNKTKQNPSICIHSTCKWSSGATLAAAPSAFEFVTIFFCRHLLACNILQ